MWIDGDGCMDEWMDRYMDDGQIGGWIDGYVDNGLICGWKDMVGQMDIQMINRWVGG